MTPILAHGPNPWIGIGAFAVWVLAIYSAPLIVWRLVARKRHAVAVFVAVSSTGFAAAVTALMLYATDGEVGAYTVGAGFIPLVFTAVSVWWVFARENRIIDGAGGDGRQGTGDGR